MFIMFDDREYQPVLHYIIYPIIMPLIFHHNAIDIPISLPIFLVKYGQTPEKITTIPALVSCKKLLLTFF